MHSAIEHQSMAARLEIYEFAPISVRRVKLMNFKFVEALKR